MALLNVAIPYLVLNYVAPKLPASLLPIILALTPGVIYLMALALRLERFGALRFAGICIGLVGVLVILLPKASLPEPGMAGWLALSLVATFSYALRAVLAPLMRPPATTSLSLAGGLLIAATVIMLVIMAVSGQWWAFGGELGIGHWAVIGGMLNNALLLVLIFEVIRLVGPVFFGSVNYISMLVGVGARHCHIQREPHDVGVASDRPGAGRPLSGEPGQGELTLNQAPRQFAAPTIGRNVLHG